MITYVCKFCKHVTTIEEAMKYHLQKHLLVNWDAAEYYEIKDVKTKITET